MSDDIDRYHRSADRFGDAVAGMQDWAAASPCEGWTAADVVNHVVGTQRDFLTAQGVDLGPAPDGSADPAHAWRAHDERVRALLADPAVAGRTYDGFFGPTTVGATLATFYGFDLVAHRWDLGRAADREERFDDGELDLLERSVAGFGEHLYAEGICRPALAPPADADRQTRVLALLGRDAG